MPRVVLDVATQEDADQLEALLRGERRYDPAEDIKSMLAQLTTAVEKLSVDVTVSPDVHLDVQASIDQLSKVISSAMAQLSTQKAPVIDVQGIVEGLIPHLSVSHPMVRELIVKREDDLIQSLRPVYDREPH